MRILARVRQTFKQLYAFRSAAVKDLEGYMLITIPVEVALKKQSSKRFWKLIFNTAVESFVNPDMDRRNARYSEKINCWRRK